MSRATLVPLDGSRFAEQALPFAVSVARRKGGALHLLFVSELSALNPPRPHTGPWTGAFREQQEKYLHGVAERVRAAGVAPVESALRDGVPAHVIAAQARARDCELIVMTTHGRGGLARAWLGSVTSDVLHEVTIPTLVIRPPDDEHGAAPADGRTFAHTAGGGAELHAAEPTAAGAAEPAKPRAAEAAAEAAEPATTRAASPYAADWAPAVVIAALDESERAEHALLHAAELAALYRAELVLLEVAPPYTGPTSPYLPHAAETFRESHAEHTARATAYLAATERRLTDRVPPIRSVRSMVDAHPNVARGILLAAQQANADVIVVGTHGLSGIRRALLGSVADKVLRAADRPVLVCRSDAPSRAPAGGRPAE